MRIPEFRPVTVLSTLLLATAALVPGARAGATTSDPARSIDNIPPAPVTDLQALNTGDEVLITWTASTDDARTFSPFGDAFVPVGGVSGYRVYRSLQGGPEELVGTAAPGATEFTDTEIEPGLTYVYTVRPFDADNETDPDIVPGSPEDLARIVALGGGPPEVVVTRQVKARMAFDVVIDLDDEDAVETFKVDLVALLAEKLGIDPARITITSIVEGSTIVQFEIADLPGAEDEPDAEAALATLIVLVEDEAEDEFASIGPVLEIVDESIEEVVVIPQPLDADGSPVLGWFSRLGTQVGFDDFFLFADHFGTTEGDPGYDATFDIAPNGAVDFDDFFRFADDFGTTIANAAEIQQLLGL